MNLGNIWLGVNDADNEGEWRNECGHLQTYLPWESGQPNNYGGDQDYVHLHMDGTWGDAGNGGFDTLCTHILSGTAP